MKKINKIILISFLAVLLDQLSKIVIRCSLGINYSISVIGDFFRITHIENEGAAWSILNGKWVFLAILSILFLIFLFRCIIKDNRNTRLNLISYSFLIGGIIGNLIDRIIYQKVTDFLSFKIFGYNFPVFNIADTFIVIGMIMLIIDIFLEGREDGPMIEEYNKIKEGTNGKVSSRGRKH